MKCDGCGHEFPPDEAVVETRHEATGPAGPLGQATRIARLTLCSRCAEGRQTTKAVIFWPVMIFGAIVALTILKVILDFFAP